MWKKMAVLFLSMVFWGISCHVAEPERNAEKYFQRKPVKTVGYQIRLQDRFVGYMHKYEWETMRGEKLHYYIVYDKKGNLIGQIHKDGETIRYNAAGKGEVLGNYTLKRALGSIYDSSIPLQVVRADKDMNYSAWARAGENSPQNVEDFWVRGDIDWSKVQTETVASSHKQGIPEKQISPKNEEEEKRSDNASVDDDGSADDDSSDDDSSDDDSSDDDSSDDDWSTDDDASDDDDSTSAKESWPEEDEAWPDE